LMYFVRFQVVYGYCYYRDKRKLSVSCAFSMRHFMTAVPNLRWRVQFGKLITKIITQSPKSYSFNLKVMSNVVLSDENK
jgi:hypothetical protein